MTVLLLAAVITGAAALYAGLTGSSLPGEIKAALRGEPSPASTGTGLLDAAKGVAHGGGAGDSTPATASTTPGDTGAGGTPSAAGAGKAAVMVNYVRAQTGKPYLQGAERMGPRGYDCSGLTYMAAKEAGIVIGLDSYAQVLNGVEVAHNAADVRPGDLVFTRGDTPTRDNGHVAMVVSSTTEIMAPAPGDVVKEVKIPFDRVQHIRRIVQ